MRSAILALALGCLGAAPAISQEASNTLLVYDSMTKPFSMENEIDPIAILLARFDPTIVRRAATEVQLPDMEKAARIVVVGTGGFPAMPPVCLDYLEKTTKPLVGIGAASSLGVPGKIRSFLKPSALTAGQLIYSGSEWPAQVDPYFPVEVASANVLARVLSSGHSIPICWREGNRIGFAALPSSPPLSMIFSDALIDLFDPSASTTPALLFIVRDFNPSCSAESLRRLTDYFSHEGIPFAVTTQMRDLPEGTSPMPREEFVGALAYAESHGGRIFIRDGEGLKDSANFAPLKPCGIEDPVQPDSTALQIGRPALVRTPEDSVSSFFIHTPMRLSSGGWLWPANVRGGLDGDLLGDIRRQVHEIISFRGGVAGVVIPAWLPFQSMRDLVDAARSVGVTPIDPLTAVPEPNPFKKP